MGKHVSMKHFDDESHDKQPGCMWGLVSVLDYHHWHSNVRKMIHYRKYEGRTHDKCDWSPQRDMYLHDACEDEKLLDEKQSPLVSTKRSHATKKRSLRARIKALIVEEFSRENKKTREKGGLSFKPNLQRTYSIHHLEAVDDGLDNKICRDWKNPVIFLPRNVENASSQSSDTTRMKAAGNLEAGRGECSMQRPKNAAKIDSKEDPDVFEIFKVDKELLLKHLQDSDESIANFSHSAFGSSTKAKFSKSRSFPVDELAQRRKLKPIKLESKQKEVLSFPREDKFQTVNQAPRLDGSGYLGTRSDELAGVESNVILSRDMMNKQDKQKENDVTMPSDVGSDMVKSGRTSLPLELNELPNKSGPSEAFEEVANKKANNAMDRNGDKHDESRIRKHTHRRNSSLNESLDKYARLFENSFGKEAKLNSSKSLKLTNESGHVPLFFRRIRSLSYVDYYSNISFEVLDENPSGNELVVIAKHGSSGLENSEEEKVAGLPISGKENMPLNANMQIKEDYASLRLHPRDGECKNEDSLEEEADKLKKSDSLCEKETNYPDVAHEELQDEGLILDSDISLQETEPHAVKLQIPEGVEHGSTVPQLKSSIDTNDLESPQGELLLIHSTLNLENDEISDKITNFERDRSLEEKDSDLDYVRHLLDRSGIAVDASNLTWHASNQPLNPQLFEEVEASWPHEEDELTGWPDFCGCWHHKMLFDLVNEVLIEVYDISFPYYPKALSSSCHVRPLIPTGNHFIEEVCTSIGSLLDMEAEEKQLIDCIVARDLAHDRSWMNLQLESESVALDLEDMIFSELLQEVIFS